MSALKHVGRVKATGRKVLVAFRTLPGEADAALVIQTENLTDNQHDELIKLVESPAGQSAYEFAEVLGRARFGDGSTMLANLHVNGRLTKVPTSDIEMTPNLHTTISLDELNQLIASQRGLSVNDLALGNQIQDAASINEVPVNNTVAAETQVAEIAAQPLSDKDLANKYRADAERLLQEAANLKRMADELVPAADPVVVKPAKKVEKAEVATPVKSAKKAEEATPAKAVVADATSQSSEK